MNFTLNKDIEWSLTGAARDAIEELLANGIEDEDFALSILEQIWPQEAIFRLDTDIDSRGTDSQYGDD